VDLDSLIAESKTMLPTRKSVPAGNRTTQRPPDHRKETQTAANGMVMSPIHQVWPKPSCKAQ
ncbi:hypothetical protein, partial [Thiolapillus sp.]|uniref:hypothetical protein n=1 Tax=Thiolapillus sp. TaxID=2017437 RepID=UPI0025EE8434